MSKHKIARAVRKEVRYQLRREMTRLRLDVIQLVRHEIDASAPAIVAMTDEQIRQRLDGRRG